MAESGLAQKVVRVHRALERARIPHAFGGALALAYYATPRATVDIDVNVFVPVLGWTKVAAALRRVGVKEMPAEGEVARNGQCRAWWGRNPVDLFFSYDEVHEAMRTACRTVPFGEATIPILAPEHLMVAKVAFNRAKDWIDIEEMLIALDAVDLGEVRRWLDHLVSKTDPRAKRFAALAGQIRGG
ncbi:MAG: hypothetical protein WDA27_03110 [Actinomycetota bacterium]